MMLTQEKLKRLIDYDPETGVFTWRDFGPGSRKVRGKAAGTDSGIGYLLIRVAGRLYKAHRLAWLYVHGKMPRFEIDHINGVRNDNRIKNLRDVPHRLNMHNSRAPSKGNTSGFLGVHFDTKRQKYVASISIDRRVVFLGRFECASKAHQAYLSAKSRLHEGSTLRGTA